MRDTFGKKEYTCKCGCIMEDYVWLSEIKKHRLACFKCGNTLGYGELSQKKVTSIISIRTPTKNR
jgi:hypothetical protein